MKLSAAVAFVFAGAALAVRYRPLNTTARAGTRIQLIQEQQGFVPYEVARACIIRRPPNAPPAPVSEIVECFRCGEPRCN